MRFNNFPDIAAFARLLFVSAAIFVFSASAATENFKTSFDCSMAGSEAEKTICRVKELAAADVEMASMYKRLLSGLPAGQKSQLKQEQRAWLKTRNKCGDSKSTSDCIKDLYRERIAALKKQEADVQSSGRGSSANFVSPDKSCLLLYEGPTEGEGAFYDVSSGKKQAVHQSYFRIGPVVTWMSNSIAELLVSEGSPAYHSYYYDCRDRRTSPSYFQPIAFNPDTRMVATIEDEEIVFYRLFSEREFYRAKTPDIPMLEYLMDCESAAKFDGPDTLRVTMKKCAEWHDVDLKIKIPN